MNPETLYHVTVKAGFCKTVELYYISRPCDISSLAFILSHRVNNKGADQAADAQAGLCLCSHATRSDLEVIKPFSCSTQLSMRFQLLIKTKIPTYK